MRTNVLCSLQCNMKHYDKYGHLYDEYFNIAEEEYLTLVMDDCISRKKIHCFNKVVSLLMYIQNWYKCNFIGH